MRRLRVGCRSGARRRLSLGASALVAAAAALVLGALALAIPGDTVADRVFGQPGFTTAICNNGGISASGLCVPNDAALDAAGHLYVADTYNHRVLEYDSPLTSSVANRVFGQPDFTTAACDGVPYPAASASSLCGPEGVAVDGAGHLYVADNGNSRVLEYDSPLTSSVADRVFGQPDFTTRTYNNGGISASSLNRPSAAVVDAAGRLYVADYDNSRVLEYDSPLTSSVANRVFGQPGGFTTNACNNGGISASSLCNPYGVAVDGAGHLYVADYLNNRVLEYDSPLSSAVANRVFGQPDFATNTPNSGGVSASSLYAPAGVALDAAGRLYVADSNTYRVLEYDSPLTSSVADRVFGQPGFTTNTCNGGGGSASSLCLPEGVALDGSGNLYIADSGNNRVLEYDSALACPDNDAPGGTFGGTVPPAPHWIYDGVGPEGASTGCDSVDPNDDNNGCDDVTELGANHVLGGQRDPLNPWDFADMWTPALPLAGSRNGAISLQDVLSDLTWVGTSPGGAPNANGRQYDADSNSNGVKDGVEYDRTASMISGQPWHSGPPNGAVTLQDVLVVLASVGDRC